MPARLALGCTASIAEGSNGCAGICAWSGCSSATLYYYYLIRLSLAHRPFVVSPSNHRPYIYLTTIFLRQAQDKSFFFDSCFNVSISPRMRASFLALLHPWSCCSLMRASCWASLFLLILTVSSLLTLVGHIPGACAIVRFTSINVDHVILPLYLIPGRNNRFSHVYFQSIRRGLTVFLYISFSLCNLSQPRLRVNTIGTNC